nr:unnamed protein product [Digitaria exilis]
MRALLASGSAPSVSSTATAVAAAAAAGRLRSKSLSTELACWAALALVVVLAAASLTPSAPAAPPSRLCPPNACPDGNVRRQSEHWCTFSSAAALAAPGAAGSSPAVADAEAYTLPHTEHSYPWLAFAAAAAVLLGLEATAAAALSSCSPRTPRESMRREWARYSSTDSSAPPPPPLLALGLPARRLVRRPPRAHESIRGGDGGGTGGLLWDTSTAASSAMATDMDRSAGWPISLLADGSEMTRTESERGSEGEVDK